MRFEQYLTEEEISVDEIITILKKGCKPFLNQFKGNLLYRGAYGINLGIIKKFPRKHRTPMSIHPKVQIILDDLFEKKFKWRPRSEGVFASGDSSMAIQYGNDYYSFWPIGKFKYIWSPNISDLFEDIYDTSQDWVRWFTSGHDHLAEFVDTYTDKNLVRGIRSNNEIMIGCKSYYMVLNGYDGEIRENL